MKKNNWNLRTCIVTRNKYKKDELIRFVIINNNAIVDKEHNIGARGYYLKKDLETINLLKNRKILEKRFSINNIEEFYANLK